MIARIVFLFSLLTCLTACSSESVANTLDGVTSEELWCQRDGHRIYGILYRPAGNDGKQMPLIILSHGFGGTHSIVQPYAEALASEGYLCYIFDFCGGGNGSRSDGSTTEMSIFTEREDLEAVISQLKVRPDVDASRITLMGESQGGMVSAITASRHTDEIASIILLYPALCIPDDAKRMYTTPDDIPATSNLWGTQLGRIYYEGLYDFDVWTEIARYERPVLLIHGDRDNIVNISYAERASQTYKDVEYHVLSGAGHGFSGSHRQQAIGYAKTFLSNKLSTGVREARIMEDSRHPAYALNGFPITMPEARHGIVIQNGKKIIR